MIEILVLTFFREGLKVLENQQKAKKQQLLSFKSTINEAEMKQRLKQQLGDPKKSLGIVKKKDQGKKFN